MTAAARTEVEPVNGGWDVAGEGDVDGGWSVDADVASGTGLVEDESLAQATSAPEEIMTAPTSGIVRCKRFMRDDPGRRVLTWGFMVAPIRVVGGLVVEWFGSTLTEHT